MFVEMDPLILKLHPPQCNQFDLKKKINKKKIHIQLTYSEKLRKNKKQLRFEVFDTRKLQIKKTTLQISVFMYPVNELQCLSMISRTVT